MQVRSTTADEVRLTLEALLGARNDLGRDDPDGTDAAEVLRRHLVEHGFSRAPRASVASLRRLVDRLGEFDDVLRRLPDVDVATASALVNEQLSELAITPSVVDHDGVGPHLHWTAPTARFDDQVVADLLMALSLELCDQGTARFGRCAAEGCDDLFYDATKNRSRRFCPNPRCASRTHTADHRARRRR